MNSILEQVSNHVAVATRILGAERVRNILREHFAERASQLRLLHVDGFLRDLKHAVDEKLECKPCEAPKAQQCGAGASPAPTSQPSEVDFRPFYELVDDARKVLGNIEVSVILRRHGGKAPSTIAVCNVNDTMRELREAVEAATPTRRLLNAYIAEGYVCDEAALKRFADYIDSRKPASTAPAEEIGY